MPTCEVRRSLATNILRLGNGKPSWNSRASVEVGGLTFNTCPGCYPARSAPEPRPGQGRWRYIRTSSIFAGLPAGRITHVAAGLARRTFLVALQVRVRGELLRWHDTAAAAIARDTSATETKGRGMACPNIAPSITTETCHYCLSSRLGIRPRLGDNLPCLPVSACDLRE